LFGDTHKIENKNVFFLSLFYAAVVYRIEIEIIDLNDNVPEFEVDLYNISIIENLPKGFSILQVNAIDRDQVRTTP
jgi:hypothetical protein